jgi:hypothetical protein
MGNSLAFVFPSTRGGLLRDLCAPFSVKPAARAFPRRLPIDTAAGSLPRFSGVSIYFSISPLGDLGSFNSVYARGCKRRHHLSAERLKKKYQS